MTLVVGKSTEILVEMAENLEILVLSGVYLSSRCTTEIIYMLLSLLNFSKKFESAPPEKYLTSHVLSLPLVGCGRLMLLYML